MSTDLACERCLYSACTCGWKYRQLTDKTLLDISLKLQEMVRRRGDDTIKEMFPEPVEAEGKGG